MAPKIKIPRPSRAPRSSEHDNETDEERRRRLAPLIAQEADKLFAQKEASQAFLDRENAEARQDHRIVIPPKERIIAVYPAVAPPSVQVREASVKNGNPHLEGVSWVNYSRSKETRIHRSFEIHPLHLKDVHANDDTRGVMGKVFKRKPQQWKPGHAERHWIIEDSDSKLNADQRPTAYKPRKTVKLGGLDRAIDDTVGNYQETWPAWFAHGDAAPTSTRPVESPPSGERKPITLPQSKNMYEAALRYGAGNNEYDMMFSGDLVGLSWTGMERTTWSALDYEIRADNGSLPPKLENEITDSWTYVGEGGHEERSWLEERRYEGVLVDVVVHDLGSMVKRMQHAFMPEGATAGVKCVPAENVAWRMQPESFVATGVSLD